MALPAPAAIEATNQSVAGYARDLARRHGVAFSRDAADELAEAATILADNELPPADATDDLLVALGRARVLTADQVVHLIIQHHRETR
jgi:hypothetical protein